MRLRIIGITLAISFLLNIRLPGQEGPSSFERITDYQGLSQVCVAAIHQDRQGFLWFGTKDGLNRYDGYTFTIYRHVPFDPDSLSSSRITAIRDDPDGRLWVGTFESGLNMLDPDSGRFLHFGHQPGNPDSLSGDCVRDIAVTPDGAVWVATSNPGLDRLVLQPPAVSGQASSDSPAKAQAVVTHFRNNPRDPASLGSDSVSRLLVDRRGRLWIGSQAGLEFLDPDPPRETRPGRPPTGSAKRDGNPMKFRHWTVPGPGQASFGVNALCEDSHGILWLGTTVGLFRFDPRQGRPEHFFQNPPPERPGLRTIKAICESPLDDATNAGKLWLGTYGGLVLFDMARQTFRYTECNPNRPEGLEPASILTICRDRGGVVWLGSNGEGVYKYDELSARFNYPDYAVADQPGGRISTRHLSIRSICEDTLSHGDTLWLGARGLFQADRRRGRLRKLNLGPPWGDDPGIVFSILQDRRGVVWVGAGQGLFRYLPRTATFTHYFVGISPPNGNADTRVFKILEDRDGEIWVMTARSIGHFDQRTGRVRHFWFDRAPPNPFEDPVFPTAYQDETGAFWLGTPVGLLRLDPRLETFQRFLYDPHDSTSLSDNVVLSLAPDFREPNRLLWLGTAGGGLNRLDRRTGRFTHFTEEDGLPSNYIYGILTDRAGTLWLSTNNGLSRFDPESGASKNHDVHDGLQGNEFNAGAFFQSASGEMFFGGINGFNSFYPETITDNPFIPPIVITDCQVNNRPASLGEISAASRQGGSADTEKELHLSYTDQIIMFRCAALNFSNPEQNQYAYLLTGFQNEWVPLGKRRAVTFTHLDPGEYLFRMKCCNNDGVWNETGISVRITIQPPFWRTWWAYGLLTAIILSVLFGVRRYEVNRLRLKYSLNLLEKEMQLAFQIQLDLLPKVPPQVDGYDIAGRSAPSHWVGGDYFDFIPVSPHRLAFCLGDVSGKGLPAALLMANLQAIIRSQTQPDANCRETVWRSNNLLAHNTDWGKFATLFHAILDSSGHRLHFCCAGHNHPILFSRGHAPARLQTGGIVLGFAQDSVYEEETIDLQPGDTLVVFSDGISEARNERDEEFGEERLVSVAAGLLDLPAAELTEILFKAVRNHTGELPQADDMTLVVVKRENPNPAAQIKAMSVSADQARD